MKLQEVTRLAGSLLLAVGIAAASPNTQAQTAPPQTAPPQTTAAPAAETHAKGDLSGG